MRNIDVMLSRPGIYAIVAYGCMGLVEVDGDGRCYQLELASGTYARDGELRAGGWAIDSIIAIHGPFSRAARTAHREAA